MKTLIKDIQNEFKLRKFLPNYDDKNENDEKCDEEYKLKQFYGTMWPLVNNCSLFYLIYRLFIATYYTLWFIESIFRNIEFRSQTNSIIYNRNRTLAFLLHPWQFYMTSWSLTILLLHLWASAILVLYFRLRNSDCELYESDSSQKIQYEKCNVNDLEAQQQVTINQRQHTRQLKRPEIPLAIKYFIKFSWICYQIIAITAIFVSVSYFSYVYKEQLEVEDSLAKEIGNFHRHGINSLVVIIDICILAYPVHILHGVYTLIYGYLYTLVTYSYWLQDKQKNVIYVFLDYNKPIFMLGVICFLTFLTFFLQFLHYLVYKFKLHLRSKFYGQEPSVGN